MQKLHGDLDKLQEDHGKVQADLKQLQSEFSKLQKKFEKMMGENKQLQAALTLSSTPMEDRVWLWFCNQFIVN